MSYSSMLTNGRVFPRLMAFPDTRQGSIFSLKNEPERGSEAIRRRVSFLEFGLEGFET